ncbi:hypothetical protein CMU66_13930 [Elizabethkingia anophelis]|nr:hypothetical protein [Elizabethkingia anophelis]MDV3564934.1 hypothetical protein [Elizabethkingia anophelis]MDV3623441.1 hypothetical protein [Elizabethkingia anophelis]MDV3657922.1 hypothetical protein [Elizabethkingia anophelis]
MQNKFYYFKQNILVIKKLIFMNLNGADINSLLILKNEDKVVLFRIIVFLLLLTGIIFWCKYDKVRHCTKNKSKEKK